MRIQEIINPKNWTETFRKVFEAIPGIIRATYLFSTFFVLLLFFLAGKVMNILIRIPLLGGLFKFFANIFDRYLSSLTTKIIDKLETTRSSEVKRMYLIELAYRNMMIKKARSLITIFGMSVGVGAIVLLLSLGYGIERLIINKVAGLDELKMLDISAGENTALRLNEAAFKKINSFKENLKALPVISVVGRINYNRAQTDVLVYAVSNDYLKSGINSKFLKGKPFANNGGIGGTISQVDNEGEVAGASTTLVEVQLGTKIVSGVTIFNILPGNSATVWEDCSINSKILGYTTRIEGGFEGSQIWGGDYYPFSQNGRVGYDRKRNLFLGKWVRGKLPLYEKNAEDILIPAFDDMGRQKWEEGCIPVRDVQILNQFDFGSVLGESTGSAEFILNDEVLAASDEAETATESALYDAVVIASDESGIETISLQASDSAKINEVKTLKFDNKPDGDAVVSSGFLNLLGIDINRAVGTTFKTSFIIVKSLMPDIEGKVFTSEIEYKIVGVVEDADNTYFYVPFEDLYKLGIKNFSQFKMILKNQKDLPKVRSDIETMGFRTNSTFDTVKQIESLFANLRVLLAVLGMVALGVASLGMFNTLTVSLLERTRETGGMKAIGMVSDEVQDLFLAEAMIMGLSGGIGGLIFGTLIGCMLSLFVSIIAITQGQGFLQLNYLPPTFVLFIIISAFIVGLLTGLYPAYRAKKTSALNALRYE